MSRSEKPGVAERDRRGQRRISVGLQIVVRGTDGSGRRFEETSQVLDVSRTGASFTCSRELPMGADLELLIPKLGLGRPSADDFQTLAHVMRVGPAEGGGFVIGAQFVGPRFHRVFITEQS
jgi:hypothetical protein